eukprot:CAMPEP_0173283118 /NCGR_PEP_ID=MMETSP1143-20121109/7220_1 /TAXON_ID=483371 /ORGANISM="non described non described, Strain CCMP2298" /LENGTH=231 /DNA_ID=CAMNT_0014220809 /DNA_START=11 /DNA_END=702 /DNA_ORIENTATION=+
MESVLEISAHKYGNYHKYYTFHPSSARSNFFADDEIYLTLWRAQGQPQLFSLLDVGCNEGNLSVDLLLQARKALPGVTVTLLGLDLDSHLIGLAQKKYQGWGQEQEQKQEQEQEQEQEQKRQQEQGQQQEHRLQGVEFLAIDFMDEAATAAVCATHLRRMRALYVHKGFGSGSGSGSGSGGGFGASNVFGASGGGFSSAPSFGTSAPLGNQPSSFGSPATGGMGAGGLSLG